jgi:two-component system, cell cycle response regulator DivK
MMYVTGLLAGEQWSSHSRPDQDESFWLCNFEQLAIRIIHNSEARTLGALNMSKKQVAEAYLIPVVPVVLIAEDQQDIRQVTKLLLEAEGCSAIEAANGLEALQAALSLKVHLILMDIDMPIMDGLEAARCLRQNDCTRGVPIVAVTAHNNQTRQEAIEAGCNDFLEKPLMPAMLRDALAKYVNSGINYRFL